MDETKDIYYPIYHISIRWLQQCKPDKEYVKWQTNDAPSGMFFNSTSFYKAFKEKPNDSELDKIARERWEKCKKKYSAETPVIIIHFLENESWWITWFQHETFDVGQSDEEALVSFSRYIHRKQLQNLKKYNDSNYALMGAEDRYRWHGAEPDGKPENRSKPPCRCKFCKEQGLIRIAH